MPVDREKYQSFDDACRTGINNYILFQKFSAFRWPAWVNAMDHSGGGVLPYMLLNNAMRDSLLFTNFLSHHGLAIDMANMFSPTYAAWSLETWIVAGGEVYRPADDWSRVRQERDTKNSLIHTTWSNGFCQVSHAVFGARSTVDEVVIETECVIKDRKDASVLFVLRPYDCQRFGGVESVKFVKESLTLEINGRKSICFAGAPEYAISGDGDRGSDIDPVIDDRRVSAESKFGMATLGLAYTLKKGENRFAMRISLDPAGEPPFGTFNFNQAKDDFIAFSTIRIRSGANALLPDKTMQNWLYGLKISMLTVSMRDLYDENGAFDYRAAYYAVFGSNRMGFFTEALKYVDHSIGRFSGNEKSISFTGVIDLCYLLEAIADYFIHVRDVDFLRERFEGVKKKAVLLFNYSRKIKRAGGHDRNSLPNYAIAEEHPFDYALIAHALGQYSYLARCLGIFGEELKYRKESDRLAGIFA
ncbi:MAG: hypothetical protein E4G96_03635, partial [Chrysiogenales bacterium]